MAENLTSRPFPSLSGKREERGRIGGSPFKVGLYSLLLIVVLTVVGGWTSHAVWESIVHTYSTHLTAILDADIAALDVWVKNEISFSRAQAKNPLLREEVESLVMIHRNSPAASDTLREVGSSQIFQQLMQSDGAESDYLGFLVLASDGTILATSFPENYVGVSLVMEGNTVLADVFAGRALLEKPHLQGTYLPGRKPLVNRPLMYTAAPVYGADGSVVAAFVRVLDPDKDFTRILSVARVGTSGDTYAFNREGYLISDSRFEEQLQSIGLLPNVPESRSILSVQIRDPGGDMTEGYQPLLPLAERPLTRMAASAVAGNSGVDVSGYRDYRGVTVIGAWRWLPELGFGVATEVRKYDAFIGHRPVKMAFIALFLLLVSACGWFLYSSISIYRLRNRIAEIKQLGQYRLLDKIGEGGVGKVFRASHALLKRPTAVKFLRPEVVTEEMLLRFEREVQLTSSLTHPNTIQIYDYGKTDSGIFYYAMEMLEGINLAQLVELSGPVDVARTIHILKHVCFSLEEAHGIGLIHRDIKPMNIMLCERGGQHDCVKVLDFGLAKEFDGLTATDITTHQAIIGTPAYIAPERLRGQEEVDHRSDIYSLGAVGYNLLTGEDVFSAGTAVEICYHVMKTEPEPPSVRLGRSVPPPLEQLIMACLAKKPEARPIDVRVIIQILEELEDGFRWDNEQAEQWWRENREQLSTGL